MFEPAVARMIADGDFHIAIAGAGGWLGLATLDLLEQALGDQLEHRVSCYGSAERNLCLNSGRQVRQRPLSELKQLEADAVWLLHFAFQTKDRADAMSEEAYRASNAVISDTVLDAVRVLPVDAMFVASSGAAAKASDPLATPAMRLYGQMKLEDEDRFATWATENQRRAVIGRIFNITGPYINKHQAYAIASFILDALQHRPIAVRAPREVLRGYVAIRELMSLVFALLAERSEAVTRFDSGGMPMELGDVAQIVARTLGGTSVERAAIVDVSPDRYFGDNSTYGALRASFGIGHVPLERQIIETAQYLQALHA